MVTVITRSASEEEGIQAHSAPHKWQSTRLVQSGFRQGGWWVPVPCFCATSHSWDRDHGRVAEQKPWLTQSQQSNHRFSLQAGVVVLLRLLHLGMLGYGPLGVEHHSASINKQLFFLKRIFYVLWIANKIPDTFSSFSGSSAEIGVCYNSVLVQVHGYKYYKGQVFFSLFFSLSFCLALAFAFALPCSFLCPLLMEEW